MRVQRFSTSGKLAGNEDDAGAARSELVDERVDFSLRSDVDAARRLVENQDPAARREPLGQHQLLLVAAGKTGSDGIHARGANPQTLEIGADQRALGAASNEGPSGQRVENRKRGIGQRRHRQHQALPLAIFRNQAEAGAHRVPGTVERHRLASDPETAGHRRDPARTAPARSLTARLRPGRRNPALRRRAA